MHVVQLLEEVGLGLCTQNSNIWRQCKNGNTNKEHMVFLCVLAHVVQLLEEVGLCTKLQHFEAV